MFGQAIIIASIWFVIGTDPTEAQAVRKGGVPRVSKFVRSRSVASTASLLSVTNPKYPALTNMMDPLVAIAGQPLPPIAPIIIGMLIGGGIGAAIGKAKGRVGLGLILGMFLGLIGWIIVAVLPSAKIAQGQGGPFCPTCRGPGRWIPASNGWGCDRCQTMIMAPPMGSMPGPPPQA